MENGQTIEVPDTSRCVRVLPDSSEANMLVLADRLSDCLVLQQKHIKLHGHCTLEVCLNSVLMQDADSLSDGQSTYGRPEEWQQTFTIEL